MAAKKVKKSLPPPPNGVELYQLETGVPLPNRGDSVMVDELKRAINKNIKAMQVNDSFVIRAS